MNTVPLRFVPGKIALSVNSKVLIDPLRTSAGNVGILAPRRGLISHCKCSSSARYSHKSCFAPALLLPPKSSSPLPGACLGRRPNVPSGLRLIAHNCQGLRSEEHTSEL